MVEGVEGGAAAAVRLAGGAPLRETLDVTDPGDWLALDAGVREAVWERSRFLPGWERSAPLPDEPTGLDEARLALALCHRDGRVRQEALRHSVRHPELLSLVVIRCADWVRPVREDARQVLGETLDVDTALALAPLVLRVGRRDRGAFGVEVLGRVLRRASHERLARLFSAHDRPARRFAYRLSVEGRLLRPAELARVAARDQDTVVQDLCATAALASLRDEDVYEDVLSPLLSAANPRTRSAGVTALRRAGRSEEAWTFLGDRSGVVRACARYVVRQQGGDPVPWYRERCTAPDDPALPPGAVIGLAECADRADAGLLRPLLAHPAAGVRARAVAGLRALDCAEVKQVWVATARRPLPRCRPRGGHRVAAVVRRTAHRGVAGAHRRGSGAPHPPRRLPAARRARWRRGAAGGGRSAPGPGLQAAHLGRAVRAALAPLPGRAARRPGGGRTARPEPAPLQRPHAAPAQAGGGGRRLTPPTWSALRPSAATARLTARDTATRLVPVIGVAAGVGGAWQG